MRYKFAGLLACALLAGNATHAANEQQIAAPCSPGVSFWSLLGSVGVGYADGHLQMEKLYAVCLPAPKTPSDSNYAYSPEQGGKLSTVIKNADGQILGTYVWSAENISGLWELSNYKIVGGYDAIKPLAAGHYSLEFQIESAVFSRFAFSVATTPSDDPYQPAGTRYFIEGPWNDYGNIFYQRNDPESTLRFTTWVQDKIGHQQRRTVSYELQLMRARDGKVVGQDKGDLHPGTHWEQIDLYFQPPGGDESSHLKAGEILHEDGTYQVRFTLDGKPYGVYSFVVAGAKIQLQGRQTERTEPSDRIVDYLYGGRYRSWWIKRDGATAEVSR